MERYVSKYIGCVSCSNGTVAIEGVENRKIGRGGVSVSRPFLYGTYGVCEQVVDKRVDAMEDVPPGPVSD